MTFLLLARLKSPSRRILSAATVERRSSQGTIRMEAGFKLADKGLDPVHGPSPRTVMLIGSPTINSSI